MATKPKKQKIQKTFKGYGRICAGFFVEFTQTAPTKEVLCLDCVVYEAVVMDTKRLEEK